MRFAIFTLASLTLLSPLSTALAGDDAERPLSAEEFLAVTRQPFLTSAWGRFKGYVQFRNSTKTVKTNLSLAVMMHPDYLRAQFILEETDVYTVTQAYSETGMSNVQVKGPEKIQAVPLSELGVSVSDITFSFLYWDFMEELDKDRVRGQSCRVLKLRNPQTLDTATVWFAAKYAGPLRVEFHSSEGQLQRKLEFTDFEREGDLYYVKTAQLRGDGWKTQVKFKEADLAESANRPPPDNLFR